MTLMFDELLAQDGVEEVLTLRSTFGFMAYHGGGLEEMTEVIAQAAAEKRAGHCRVERFGVGQCGGACRMGFVFWISECRDVGLADDTCSDAEFACSRAHWRARTSRT